jgi:hypothetical protein
METLEKLIAIEAIKNVKARYWYYMDTKNWAELEKVFTRDAIWDARHERDFALGVPREPLPPVQEAIAAGDPTVTVGAHEVVEFMRSNVEHWVTFHVGGAPIIDVLDADNATAIWPIYDYLDPGSPFRGYAHYYESYRRENGEWLISSILLTRLLGEGDYPSDSPLSGP